MGSGSAIESGPDCVEAQRTFLFLQGPHGSFFPRLGGALSSQGHRVLRINFNGGDRATWPGAIDYAGRESRWPSYVERLLVERHVTDLVVYGDARPKHAVAIRHAKKLGARVHVFEEGYIRPDWVTLERDGVNGYSTLPRDPAWYLEQARDLPPVPAHPPVESFRTARGWGAFFYYAEFVLQYWRFPFHNSHRPSDPVSEGVEWLRRFQRRKDEHARTAQALRNLEGAEYVIFPLQLDSDYQIRLHSDFSGMRPAIVKVMSSFATHAPPTMRLAVKEHPLDAGLNDWQQITMEEARRFGITDRVDFIEHGDLLDLLQGCSGMVTVNSTAGTLALIEGKPVTVMGKAVYDIPGITHQNGLDDFWAIPQRPDPVVFDAFYRVLVDRCLLHGAFLSDKGINMLIESAARSMLRDWQEPVAAMTPARQ